MMKLAFVTEGKAETLRKALLHPVIAFVLMSLWPAVSPAQETAHSGTAEHQAASLRQKNNASALIQLVREATERYKDVSAAVADGYVLQFGCVSGPDQGAMGLHFVNGAIIATGELDPRRPQIVIYEPREDGRLQLIGADYLLFADAWNKNHSAPPELMGQLFHLFESPNRFGLPAFYTLHVWAWKDNPNGAFVNWHPNVSCEQFNVSSNGTK